MPLVRGPSSQLITPPHQPMGCSLSLAIKPQPGNLLPFSSVSEGVKLHTCRRRSRVRFMYMLYYNPCCIAHRVLTCPPDLLGLM